MRILTIPEICPFYISKDFAGLYMLLWKPCNLLQIMLRDSAHIQMAEAEWKNRKAERAGDPIAEPVYNLEDAEGVLKKLRPCHYNERIHVLEGVEIRFSDLGHSSWVRRDRDLAA